jgi:hypothetical protein
MQIRWGDAPSGARFGLRVADAPYEAGGTIAPELFVENVSGADLLVFGFAPGYPRSLRVSPPKPDRPFIRVSFADTAVLHPPDAFVRLRPGEARSTRLDLSFAFDRRGVGRWPLAFGYDPVRGAGGFRTLSPPEGGQLTPVVDLVVEPPRSLRDAGIDEATERALDDALLTGAPDLHERLRRTPGAATYLARRAARVLVPGADSALGWRAIDALAELGVPGHDAAAAALPDLPHAEGVLRFAMALAAHRAGHPPAAADLPFVAALEQLATQPDRRGNLLLSWTAFESPVHGLRRVEIIGNGDLLVATRAPGDPMPRTRRGRLNALQMQTLLDALRWSTVWLLRPLRERGMPDEPRPALEVRLALGDPYVRAVVLWNGEWRQGPAGRLADLLDRLSESGSGDSMRPGAA